MAHVVDANCWSLWVDEAIEETPGIGTTLFVEAENAGGFLFDAGNLMRQEYIDVKKPYAEELFNNWFNEKHIFGAARLVEVKSDQALHKQLGGLGIPKDDHIYIKTAIQGGAGHLISMDTDLFDPSHKQSNSEKKLKIVKSGNGPVCKYMKKIHKIVVCCPETYIESLAA